ncbi:unnamed protein product [Chrysoparadoxa australica]
MKQQLPREKHALQRRLTLSTASDKISEQDIENFRETIKTVFTSLDRDKDGTLHRAEVRIALKEMGLPATGEHLAMLFGSGNNDAISFKDFESYAMTRREQLWAVFAHLDLNNDGFIGEDDITRALDQLHIHASPHQIAKLMRTCDKNQDGAIHWPEFAEFLLLATPNSIKEVFDYWALASDCFYSPEDIFSSKQAIITLLAGALAGAVSRTVTAPVDRLKVLMQTGTQRGTIASGMKAIYYEGGWRGFWNGNGANVIKIMPENSIRLFTYEVSKRWLCEDVDDVTMKERFAAGAIAGTVSTAVIYPLEITKTRLALARRGAYKGIGDCLMQISRTDGFTALYRGLNASILGIIPYSGVDLAMFYTLRQQWMNAHPEAEEGPGVLVLLSFGAFSSTCGQLVAYPLQLVRTKLQAQGHPNVPRYAGMLDCFTSTLKEQGMKGLYRGLGPNFIKGIPAIAVSYAVYEKSREKLDKLWH